MGRVVSTLNSGGTGNSDVWSAAASSRRIVSQAPTVTILGDSNSLGYVAQSANFNTWGRQWWPTWLRNLTNQSISCRAENCLAVSGQSASGCISEGTLAAAVALASHIYVVTFGGNDARNADAYTAFSANLDTICTALLKVGGYIILRQPLPNTEDDATEFDRLQSIRQIIRDKAASDPRIFVADPLKYLIDPALTTGAPVSGMLYDAVHTNNAGAYWSAVAIKEVLDPLIVADDIVFSDGNDTYDATGNPRGNLLTNGMLIGTTGTKQTIDNTTPTQAIVGNLATSWTCTGLGAGTIGTTLVTLSKVARTDRQGTWQQAVISGTPAGAVTLNILQQSITTNFTAGDVVEAVIPFEVDADPDGLDGLFLEIYDATDNPDKGERDGTATAGHRWPATGGIVRGVLRTEPKSIFASSGTVQVNVAATFGATALDVTIRLGAASLRKIPQ